MKRFISAILLLLLVCGMTYSQSTGTAGMEWFKPFAPDAEEMVYVIGTNFIDGFSPYTWGVSHTAPIVSGVIALMKELNPGLTPRRILDLLLKSTNKTPDGYPLLDAKKAVDLARGPGA